MSDDIKPVAWFTNKQLSELPWRTELVCFHSNVVSNLSPLYDQATVESLQAKVVELEAHNKLLIEELGGVGVYVPLERLDECRAMLREIVDGHESGDVWMWELIEKARGMIK